MASINELTDTILRGLLNKPNIKQVIERDGHGLSARISKTGKIGWIFRYRLGGRECNPKQMSLGSYPETSLKQARIKRDQCRAWLDEGKDPNIEYQLALSKSLKPVTVKEALEYWLDNYAEKNRKNVDKHRRQFEKHIFPYIGKLPVEQAETRHWIECIDRICKGVPSKNQRPAPVAAGYIFQNAKQALKYCRVRRYAISRELEDLTITDVAQKQNDRDRVLTQAEFNDVLNFIRSGKVSIYYKNLLWLLIIFGCRTIELRLSEWKEWDFDNNVWTVPPEHSKSGERILRPIPIELKSFLLELKVKTTKSGYVLGCLKNAPAVSSTGGKLWQRLGHEEKWTLHDLRRTLATRMNDLGVQPHIVEHLLGHSVQGVAGIYNRSQYMDDKRVALDLWLSVINAVKVEDKKLG